MPLKDKLVNRIYQREWKRKRRAELHAAGLTDAGTLPKRRWREFGVSHPRAAEPKLGRLVGVPGPESRFRITSGLPKSKRRG